MNRDENQPEFGSHQSIDWLAFCYISDELNETERSEFELRLKDDELAQQAVVDAIHQTQVIAATQTPSALPVQPVSRSTNSARLATPRRTRRRTGVLIAMAASLLLIVFGWNGFVQPEPATKTAANESDNLAIAWADTHIPLEENELEDILDDETGSIANVEETEDWMFAALIEQTEEMEGLE